MINLDKKIGFVKLRTLGLILNFIGNALALYGAVSVIQEQKNWGFFIPGLILTIICIAILAIPSSD